MPERMDERRGDVVWDSSQGPQRLCGSDRVSSGHGLVIVGAPAGFEPACAHGSGGGLSDLANLCALPAWTRLLIVADAKIIPRIFRIMDTSAVTARTLQGMARVRSGQAPAWPLVSDRSVRSGLRSQA
jgi:hypothetical protein